MTLGVPRLAVRPQLVASVPVSIASEVRSMIAYMRAVRRHVNNDDGASAVEYGLLVAAIAAVIVVVVFALGNVVKGKIQNTCDSIANNGQANGTNNCQNPNLNPPAGG